MVAAAALAVDAAVLVAVASTSAPAPWMDGGCCRGVPAALQPVQPGSDGLYVTVRAAHTAGWSTVDMSSTLCASAGVPRLIVDTCAAAPCFPLIARTCDRKQQDLDRHRPLDRAGAAGLLRVRVVRLQSDPSGVTRWAQCALRCSWLPARRLMSLGRQKKRPPRLKCRRGTSTGRLGRREAPPAAWTCVACVRN